MTDLRGSIRGEFVERDGARLHYLLSGRMHAPTVLLLHALGSDATAWQTQLPALERAFRVLRIDTRGHGRSNYIDGDSAAAAAVAHRGIGDYAADVVAVLDALRIERAHWCGVSMGGMVAMWAAGRTPATPGEGSLSQRVGRLVLANTSAHMGPHEVWDTRIETVRREGLAPVAATVGERWFGAQFRAVSPEVVDAAARRLMNTSPRGYVEACIAIRDMDQRPMLGAITAPTLVIAGTQDVATPIEHAEHLVEHIRGADLAVLDAGHMAAIEQAEEFTATLIDFLRD
jgi:3-oxoadipate enol-lactonase